MKKPEELKKELLKQIPEQFQDIVLSAVLYTTNYHSKDTRFNGEPLISHLLKVAILTTNIEMDVNSTIAALLHEIKLEEEKTYIIQNFGIDIFEIIQRIKAIKESTETLETPSEIIVKYILASSEDLRPVIIKILDTLEDSKSIQAIPSENRKISLSKVLNIYSVLAEYLNLDEIKKEIDENAFKEYLPLEYESISKVMKEENIEEKLLNQYKEKIEKLLENSNVNYELKGRIKSKYSIYNKLKKQEKEWKSPNIWTIKDLIAFRLITDTVDSCFMILEKLMDGGDINLEEFDDYISNPKPNNYRAVQFPMKFEEIGKLEIEIQVMTKEMYYCNTYGTASHVAYKASKQRFAKPSKKYNWIEEIHKEIDQNKKLREKENNLPIACHIFEDRVFAFTPKGKIIDLDKKDTVLDFAFKLHTQIGNRAVSTTVNDKPAKLSSLLKTGDVVNIKIDKDKKYQKAEVLQFLNSENSKTKVKKELSKINIK